jgi:hypothetical protein
MHLSTDDCITAQLVRDGFGVGAESVKMATERVHCLEFNKVDKLDSVDSVEVGG